jgi:hypothetical protein
MQISHPLPGCPGKSAFSALMLFLFFSFAFSCRLNGIHAGAFNTYTVVESPSDSGDYVVKIDGTKIYGQNAELKDREVLLDGRRFKGSQLKAVRSGLGPSVRK